MSALVSQLTRISTALVLASTGAIVAVPGAAAAPPKPRPRIVFEGTPDQGSQIVVSHPNGTRQRRLTSGPNLAEQPRWSPFGKRILYLRRTPSERFDLMVMGAGGRHKHQILSGRNRGIIDMAWGPAGRSVALVMTPGAANFSDVYIYSLRTRKLTRLHVNRPDRDPASVDWVRGGQTIAFSAVDYTEDGDDFEDHDLYLVRPNGTGLKQLTNTDIRDEWNPRFSPDGQQLAYSMATIAGAESVFIASADGTSPRRLRAGGDAHQASWSANGRRLLVQKYDRQGSDVIWSMALDGSDRRYVSHGRNADWRPR